MSYGFELVVKHGRLARVIHMDGLCQGTRIICSKPREVLPACNFGGVLANIWATSCIYGFSLFELLLMLHCFVCCLSLVRTVLRTRLDADRLR